MPHTHYLDEETQRALTPKKVLGHLIAGNKRFVDQTPLSRDLTSRLEAAKKAQFPMAFILGCIDARVPNERIFDSCIGDLFVGRVAGNVVGYDMIASLEFACAVAGSKLIVVLGHTDCGAVKAACSDVELSHLSKLLRKLRSPITTAKYLKTDKDALVDKVTHLNVAHSMVRIHQKSPLLSKLIDSGEVGIVGGIYSVGTGKVTLRSYKPELLELKAIDVPQTLVTQVDALFSPD